MRDRRSTTSSGSSVEILDVVTSSPRLEEVHEKQVNGRPASNSLLPAPATKSSKLKTSPWRRRAAIKVLAALCVLSLIWRLALASWTFSAQLESSLVSSDPDTELIGGNDLPSEPTAFIVSNGNHDVRWTVSIPHSLSFPLAGHYYQEICKIGAGLRGTINENAGHPSSWLRRHGARPDLTFLDIEQAEADGILPKPTDDDSSTVCDTSLTFVLESEDASLGKTLLLLWMSYGLAKKDGRAFFIDDTRWSWGKYNSFFAPAPAPTCTRPAPHYIVPCPRNAKHLIVSSTTAAWTFGPAFQEEFSDRHRYGQPPRIFNLIRQGYEDLFKLVGEDRDYAISHIADLKTEAVEHHTPMVGMQIRRGDQHPFEFEYSQDYLPAERYAEAAMSLMRKSGSDINSKSSLLVASDDPDMFESNDLQQSLGPARLRRAQDRILLATKVTLDATAPVHQEKTDSPFVKHIDENSGWEGGFFRALFYSAGGAKAPSHDMHASTEIPEQALQLRELIGRAYLLDVAILGAGDGVVCAISSASCRVLGVMMGWDAIKEGRWKNIDDGRPWSWNGKR